MNKVEISKQVYAAINENRVLDALKFFDTDIVRTEDFSSPGTHRGHAEVLKHFSRARSAWEAGLCEPVGFVATGNKIVVLVHVRVKIKDRTKWTEGRLADVLTFKGKKVIEMRAFAETQNALLWTELRISKITRFRRMQWYTSRAITECISRVFNSRVGARGRTIKIEGSSGRL